MLISSKNKKCKKIEIYKKLEKIYYGNYGSVYKVENTKTHKIRALKRLNPELCLDTNGFSILYLREISILKRLKHKNIIKIVDVVVGKGISNISIVMELLHTNLKIFLENFEGIMPLACLKGIIKQVLSALKYLHSKEILHRDLKTSNLLISKKGVVKVADFGLARKFDNKMSNLVVTLWYRAPEILMGTEEYDFAIDMWSIGCIIAELYKKDVIFQGNGEIDQLHRIFELLGFPDEKDYENIKVPHFKNLVNSNYQNKYEECFKEFEGKNFLQKFLKFNPSERINVFEAEKDEWLADVDDLLLIKNYIKDGYD